MPNPPYSFFPEPGTFHIASYHNRVIGVPEYNQNIALCLEWKNKPDQHWFIQRSGRGYKIKNCQYEVYLAASSGQIGTVVGTSKTPTIWNFIRTHAGFAIQYGEEDSVIDLHYGADQVENIISLWKSDGLPDARRWRFERMSDDTGGEEADVVEEEVDCLRRELAEKMEQLVLKDQEIARKDQRLAEQAALRESSQDLDKRLAELHEKIEELQQLSKAA